MEQNPVILTAFGGTTNINSNPGCRRAMEPDMSLGSCSGPDNTKTPGESAGHFNQCGPDRGMTIGHPPDYRLGPRPGYPVWSLVVTWATDILWLNSVLDVSPLLVGKFTIE